MAITSLDTYIAAAKQKARFLKTTAATTIAGIPWSLWATAGSPGAGSFAIGNTTTGVVPTSATTGAIAINAFGGGNTGYLTGVDFGSTVASRLWLTDRLWHAGSISTTSAATTSFTSQPSYVGRLPGSSYVGLSIFLEVTTAISNTAITIAVTYTNQAGTGSRSTGNISVQNFTAGRLVAMPLQAGDTGVQQVDSLIVNTATAAGAVNVLVLRTLWTGRVMAANAGDTHGLDRTGMPIVYDTSCIFPMVAGDSTSSGVPDMLIEIANG